MKKLSVLMFLLAAAAVSAIAQERQNPIVKDFGGIFDIPDADIKPDPDRMYNIVIDIAKTSDEKQYADYYLERVARLMNLHVIGGVPPEHLNVKVVVHGGAVFNLLDHEAFNKKYNMDTPNILLLERLQEAGAEIMVCGQSLMGRNIGTDQISPAVKVAVSAMTAVTTYQLEGYAVLQF